MPFKEAMRNFNWTTRAKPELDKFWRRIINKTYGLDVVQPVKACFRYFVGKGNNSRLVSRCLASRSWWAQVEDIDDCHFAWTQWKDKEFLMKVGTLVEAVPNKTSSLPYQMLSPVPFTTENNQIRPVEIDDLGFQLIRNSCSYIQVDSKETDPSSLLLYNKLEFNQHLANKKGLFKSMKNYYEALDKNLFDCLPLTFHIKSKENDSEFDKFVETFQEIENSKKNLNLWIVKPGENSNRGQGICLASTLDQIKLLISPKVDPLSGNPRTYIIQKYIEKPFLIHKRKFDIRCYALITSINGVIQGYSYTDGYLRTTSTEYNTKDISNILIHLTNDAIQKYSEEYGKFEDGNKLSYKDFQRYLDFHCSEKKINFFADVLPLIKGLIKDSIQAVFMKIDPKKRLHCMEIFGYDFMIDCNFKPWLIEVNTNPCLELSSNYLATLIPAMVENAFKVALDPLFPPPAGKHIFESFTENKFELIFHSEVDGDHLLEHIKDRKILLQNSEEISDKEEIFSDDEECLNN
jgi:tubulin polyglutamylase TTLL1/tubulin monoglycylase TTLL3/8